MGGGWGRFDHELPLTKEDPAPLFSNILHIEWEVPKMFTNTLPLPIFYSLDSGGKWPLCSSCQCLIFTPSHFSSPLPLSLACSHSHSHFCLAVCVKSLVFRKNMRRVPVPRWLMKQLWKGLCSKLELV